ncbi:MAG: hypothetical protein OJF50_000525 [Nitrospira sp.]|jgi:hypothetical protein|nr:hypothetical protein [Nitrospira sp.]
MRRLYAKWCLDSCEVITQMLTFLCCLMVVSGIHSFGVMLWLIAVGMAWFLRSGMEGE